MMKEENNRLKKFLLGSFARHVARRIHKAIRKCRYGQYCKKTGLKKGKCKDKNDNGNK